MTRSDEEQTWDASGLIAEADMRLRQFWDSRVPGSAAPECLMAGALQSLENKGLRLDPACDGLLAAGREAVAGGDFERLHRIDMRLRALMRAATPDPGHKSQKTLRHADWAAFEVAVAFPSDEPVDDATLADRIRGGWLGQLVGAAAGTALEGYTAENLERAFGRIDRYVRPPNTYNDDITFEIAFLEAFAAKGHAVTGADIAENWTGMIPLGWSAEGVALDAIRRGILPPESGRADNPFDEWIGAQMRGVICGMVAPGRARAAARLAWTDAEVSHTGNGILGEVFNAVLAARAFHHSDARALLDEAIALVPEATEYGQAIRTARRACEGAATWQDAWAACDAIYIEYNWIHVLPNAAAQVIGLWWGNGDFDRTLEVICGIGHDVDCNAAQMLGVLGLMQGTAAIAPRWTEPLLQGDIITYMRRPAAIPFDTLVAMTVDAARRHAPVA
ncbi:ADP-ribosylglycohydrolase family protein [Rubellimicrobium arenae]|uniref:ADP-ribosylglycohydrolase family protein n=1 Tax=Rubellimicrobium arenae TaxID=2817372 RepID=UPI001B30E7E8